MKTYVPVYSTVLLYFSIVLYLNSLIIMCSLNKYNKAIKATRL